MVNCAEQEQLEMTMSQALGMSDRPSLTEMKGKSKEQLSFGTIGLSHKC